MNTDIYSLERFSEAQESNESNYQIALNEIKNGRKKSCWMWFVFPQLRGLGKSLTSEYYGITGIKEAKEYLINPLLGSHLIEISQELLNLSSNDVTEIFEWPDDKKLKSCMTLFEFVAPDNPIFQKVLDKFFDGQRDSKRDCPKVCAN